MGPTRRANERRRSWCLGAAASPPASTSGPMSSAPGAAWRLGLARTHRDWAGGVRNSFWGFGVEGEGKGKPREKRTRGGGVSFLLGLVFSRETKGTSRRKDINEWGEGGGCPFGVGFEGKFKEHHEKKTTMGGLLN